MSPVRPYFDIPWVMCLSCPYCGMAWDVASALEAGRIIGQHEDVCDWVPPLDPEAS